MTDQLFNGWMPPLATSRADNFSSGVQLVPAAAFTLLTSPANVAPVGVCERRCAKATPMVLKIGGPPSAGTPFPQPDDAGFRAGMWAASGAPLGAGGRLAAAVLEYGSGSATHRVVFDWQPGSYQLPPSTFARVSVLLWGVWPTANALAAIASLSDGEIESGATPTASAREQISSADTLIVYPPAGARALDVELSDPTTPALTPIVTLTGQVCATKNYATGAFVPGWTPYDVTGPESVTVKTSVTAYLTIKWFLDL